PEFPEFSFLALFPLFVCAAACPVDISLIYWNTLLPFPLDYVRRSSTSACFMDYFHILPTLYLSAI
ncbi:hypothetical protein M9458_023506, partial [Cirrhinus mrigala]